MSSSSSFSPDMRDALALSSLLESGRIQCSDLDARRRAAIMHRAPEVFSNLTREEYINFHNTGIPFRQGHLDEWLSHNNTLSVHRNRPGIGKGGIFMLDHLPRRSVAFAPIVVPYLGHEYVGDLGDFLDYPQMWGYDLGQLRTGNFGNHSLDEGVQFLQHWLFFGLIREAVSDEAVITYDHWNKWDDSEKRYVMTSASLPRFLDIFSQRLSNRPGRPLLQWWETILRTTFAVAENFSNKFDETLETETHTSEPDGLKVLWSILTLGQMLSVILLRSYRVERTSYIEQWPDSPLVDRRLRARGLCPQEVARLKTTLSADSLYFVSLMPWDLPGNPYAFHSQSRLLPAIENLAIRAREQLEAREPLETRQTSRQDSSLAILAREQLHYGQRSHQACSLDRCNACLIDHNIYHTMHVLPECDCAFLGPEMKDVYHILTNGKIPVIQWNQVIESQGRTSIILNVVDSELTDGYVAVSHVWADGLGNAKENKLPQCQLFRITNLIRDFSNGRNVPFWIDTLCVPRDESQRPKALKLMNKTYRISTRVLVLDANLQQFKCHSGLTTAITNIDVQLREQIQIGVVVELILRIACSSWGTRLWTLPEGQVPPYLHFQFYDGAMELGELFAQLGTWPFIGTSIVSDLRTFLIRLRPRLRTQSVLGMPAEDPALLRWPSGELDGRFIALLHSLEWRDSSRSSDEVLCLATQLNMDLEIFDGVPVDHKLHVLLGEIGTLPAELIFTHGSRLPDHPFRWAPRTLLNYRNQFSFVPAAKPETPMATLTVSGLLVRYPGFVIEQGPTTASPVLVFVVPDEKSQDEFEGVNVTAYGMRTVKSGTDMGKPWNQTALDSICLSSPFCVVVGPDNMPGPDQTMEGGKMGVILKREKFYTESDIIQGTPLETVVIYKMPSGWDRCNGSTLDVRKANKLPPNQQFLIG